MDYNKKCGTCAHFEKSSDNKGFCDFNKKDQWKDKTTNTTACKNYTSTTTGYTIFIIAIVIVSVGLYLLFS